MRQIIHIFGLKKCHDSSLSQQIVDIKSSMMPYQFSKANNGIFFFYWVHILFFEWVFLWKNS